MKPSSKSPDHSIAQSPDCRHDPIRAEIVRLYQAANGLPAPWTGQHGRALKHLLDHNQQWPLETWLCCVRNRFYSEGINPAEDPIYWLKRLVNYARGPLDRYSKLKKLNAQEEIDAYWAARRRRN